ncbi:MAG: hypothetical protein HC900_13115 [Methylacidiphilales bacterium]|nr:hypothetical protein [Candidatus Methylacidiphilales bacterium]
MTVADVQPLIEQLEARYNETDTLFFDGAFETLRYQSYPLPDEVDTLPISTTLPLTTALVAPSLTLVATGVNVSYSESYPIPAGFHTRVVYDATTVPGDVDSNPTNDETVDFWLQMRIPGLTDWEDIGDKLRATDDIPTTFADVNRTLDVYPIGAPLEVRIKCDRAGNTRSATCTASNLRFYHDAPGWYVQQHSPRSKFSPDIFSSIIRFHQITDRSFRGLAR